MTYINDLDIFPVTNSTISSRKSSTLTESNVVRLLSCGEDRTSYVISYDNNSKKITFVIYGYLVVATLDSLLDGDIGASTYLYSTIYINTSTSQIMKNGGDNTVVEFSGPTDYQGVLNETSAGNTKKVTFHILSKTAQDSTDWYVPSRSYRQIDGGEID